MKGIKHDIGKLRWSLLPLKPIQEVIRVLMFGSKKYTDNNWKRVPNKRERYYNAALRHISEWYEGEIIDKESKCHKLAHALCCLIFLLWSELKGKNERKLATKRRDFT